MAGVGKAQKSFKHVELKPATCYAAEDADVTLRLYQHLRPRLAREKLLTVYETLERPLPGVLAAMECVGIRIDPEHLRRLSIDFGQRMGDLDGKGPQVAAAFNRARKETAPVYASSHGGGGRDGDRRLLD